MAMMIGNNNNRFDAFSALSFINQNKVANQREVQRTSTMRLDINDAIDNVSAYSIEESLRIRTRVLSQVTQNIQDDTALLKTAQNSGGSIVDSIKEIQKLAISATDETLTDDDRLVIQRDINRLVNQIAKDAQITFNGRKLIDGSATTGNPAIATVLSNSSLYSGTNAMTALTDLRNSDGVSLKIDANDRVTASYVKDGNIYTASFSVGDKTIEDIFKSLNTINEMTLTDSAFVGGGYGVLQEPEEPLNPEEINPGAPPTLDPEPVAPNEPNVARPNEVVASPDEVPQASLPTVVAEGFASEPIRPDIEEPIESDFDDAAEYSAALDDYEDTMANYEAELAQYEINKATYDEAVQAGAEVIQKPTALDENATLEEQAQYQSDLDAYNAATDDMTNYIKYQQYQTDLANYNQYVSDKTEWDNYDRAYAQYERDLAAYPGKVAQYNADMEIYNKKYAEYQAYKKEYETTLYPQYQEDMANYQVMIADIVQSDNEGLHVTARKPGLEGQISGVSINVTDALGNAKSAVNEALNNFKTTTFAEDERENNSVYFQIGETIDQTLNFGFDDMRAEAFGLKGFNGNIISIATKAEADAALSTIENALSKAIEHVQLIGSSEKKLGYIADSLAIEISNIQEPDLMIRNVDRAKTLTMYALDFFHRDRMQSMLAMANQHSSAVLGLLR